MNIKVENNVPNLNVSVNQNKDGSFAILLAEVKKKTLRDFKPGDTVMLGDREYIVLEHSQETTAVITKELAKSMPFGNNGDYAKSNVLEYCNGEFYKELCKAVGKKNVIPHTVSLVANDGSNKGIVVKGNVSILTTELYRRYRELLPAYGSPYWTATRTSALIDNYAHGVCCVYSNGFLDWYVCRCSAGVRPFCILKSSVMVS